VFPLQKILILSVGVCSFLFLSETFSSNISVPFHVVSAPVILIHDFLTYQELEELKICTSSMQERQFIQLQAVVLLSLILMI
jgi:hypothetical protein